MLRIKFKCLHADLVLSYHNRAHSVSILIQSVARSEQRFYSVQQAKHTRIQSKFDGLHCQSIPRSDGLVEIMICTRINDLDLVKHSTIFKTKKVKHSTNTPCPQTRRR